ncbi:MAG: GNAT family N-acetyltransferase [Armatimonadota bacterium]
MAKVSLRPIRISDAERCLRWVSDPEVQRFLGLIQPARTLDQERSWIASILSDRQHQRAFVILSETGVAIGTCGLRGVDREAGTALLGMMIGDPRLWGRGYGTAATRALLGYAFGELELREVRLSCHAENGRAIRCYEKAGFERRPAPAGRSERPGEVWMAIGRERWEGMSGAGGMGGDQMTSRDEPQQA